MISKPHSNDFGTKITLEKVVKTEEIDGAVNLTWSESTKKRVRTPFTLWTIGAEFSHEGHILV